MLNVNLESDFSSAVNARILSTDNAPRALNDDVLQWVCEQKNELLKQLFRSEMAKPDRIKDRCYRHLSPLWLNRCVQRSILNQDIRVVEQDGLSFDWLLFGKKISNKLITKDTSLHAVRRKNGKYTTGYAIPLKNTHGKDTVSSDDFDYLFVQHIRTDKSCSFYCYTYEQVAEMNQVYKSGQVKLYLGDKYFCPMYIDMTDEHFAYFSTLYRRLPSSVGNTIIDNGIHHAVDLTIDATDIPQ